MTWNMWITVPIKNGKFEYVKVAILYCCIYSSVIIIISTHWVAVHFNSPEFYYLNLAT